MEKKIKMNEKTREFVIELINKENYGSTITHKTEIVFINSPNNTGSLNFISDYIWISSLRSKHSIAGYIKSTGLFFLYKKGWRNNTLRMLYSGE